MTAPKVATRPDVQNIKTAVSSIATCTSTTVQALEALLAQETKQIVEKENVKPKRSRVPAAPPTSRRRQIAKSVDAEVCETGSAPLSSKEKYVLATDVANATLKSLSDSLKDPTLLRFAHKSKGKAVPQETPLTKRGQLSRSTSYSQKPLQERPSSQTINSPTKRPLRRSSSYSSFITTGPVPGLVATAECARVAFAYLQPHEALDPETTDSSQLQWENGMLALIGKLVAHGLDNFAVKELRILKRRLDAYLEACGQEKDIKTLKSSKATKNATTVPEKETLASLLEFGVVNPQTSVLPLIINHQLYTLRVIASTRRPRIIEAVADYFQDSKPSCPTNLLLEFSRRPSCGAKAARQLESFAQALLVLCPSVATAEDENACKDSLYPSPDAVFRLQHFAFGIRKTWWKLANHKGNVEKELYEPFSRCLAAFSRRSTLAAPQKYKLAKLLYQNLCGQLEETALPTTPAMAFATRTLSTLAHAASFTDDALLWTRACRAPEGSKESAAKTATHLIRIASLSFESALKSKSTADWENNIDQSLDALAGGLGGTAAEMDSLFAEVNCFRRIATKALAIKVPQSLLQKYPSLHTQAYRIIAAAMHFVLRYVGSRPTDVADKRSQIQENNRINMTNKMSKSLFDSALICSKQFPEVNVEWPLLDPLLQDCVAILQRLDSTTKQHSQCDGPSQDLQLPFVKLSNAYWTTYLQLRKTGRDDPAQLIQLMQRSVEVLLPRARDEWQSGLLSMKLEKLAEAQDNANRPSEARTSIRQSINCLINSQTLQESLELTGKHSFHCICDHTPDFTTLGRVLKLYHYSFLKDGVLDDKDLAFFDDKGLPPALRGLILEWQLSLFAKTFSKNRPWDPALNISVRALCDKILEVYTFQFPIRRRRALIALLKLSEEHPEILPPDTLDTACPDDPVGTQDEGLSRYLSHLSKMLRVTLTIRENSPSLETIKEALSFWQTSISSAATWADILERVDDPDGWLQQVQLIVDYLAVIGEEYLTIPAFNILSRALELQCSSDRSLLLSTLSRTGLQLLRLGYSGKAGLCFAKAKNLASSDATSTEAKVQWHLGYAEYMLAIGNVEKCESTLRSAEVMVSGDSQLIGLSKGSVTLSGRVRFNTLLANTCHVYSLLALHNGCYMDALRYAKRCVGLSRRVWAALENKPGSSPRNLQSSTDSVDFGQSTGTFDPLLSTRTEQGAPVIMSVTHRSLNGPAFWALVPLLHRGLLQQSQAFSHLGLLQEAVYVAEQADKVASATNSSSLALESASYRMEYWSHSGRPDKARTVIASVELPSISRHLAVVQYYSALAIVYHHNGDFENETQTLEKMCTILRDLQVATSMKELELLDLGIEALATQVSTLSLETSSTKENKPTRATRARKAPIKTVAKPAAKAAAKTTRKAPVVKKPSAVPSISDECTHLSRLEADAMQRQALVNVVQENILRATELLEQAAKFEQGISGKIGHLCAKFQLLFAQSMKEMARDFTFNTLPESTIAFPALFQSERRPSDGTLARIANLSSSQRVSLGVNSIEAQGTRGNGAAKTNFITTLEKARDCISNAYTLASRAGCSSTFAQVSSALGNVTVLLSAAAQGEVKGSLHPLYSAYMTESPKWLSLEMTHAAIKVDREPVSRDDFLKWPELASQQSPSLPSVLQFQHDYVDIIPVSWTAISLALSEEHDELYITRYNAGQSPFVLRLPMGRHKSRDMDEEEFGFDEGRKDFDEIIELSDFSTKSAREMTSKGSKSQWWAEREALDTRLKEFLLNIENIWLGGFRGIFSQHPHDQNLLARFKKSFQDILDRHLPSRRRRGPKKKINLEPRILELFIGLGDANDERLDLDEALTDLIYFVVDILQFNGEKNALDEIDFDTMVIETLDALRAYHSACRNIPSKQSHTILILDKNLHIFPWESLPCLQSLSISRLPSLAALRERLLAAKVSSQTAEPQPGHYISANKGGTSILNPSGDLAHTLKTIRPRLDTMSGDWTHITSRAPSEAEFENALRDQDLLLYFGHGSGAQYVRSKTVKRLYQDEDSAEGPNSRCATTLLFGCSSAHLTENGIYEPSGMLASYLAAGAPAVVGMLWDVTDKDCDRFAVRAGELWGLWPESDEGASSEATGSKGKRKIAPKVAEVENVRGATVGRRDRKAKNTDTAEDDMNLVGDDLAQIQRGVSLDEAVRGARDACVLRYLNGAAAVVYGIPVYLE